MNCLPLAKMEKALTAKRPKPRYLVGRDAIVLRPVVNLNANTTYTFVVTPGLKDVTGVGFTQFQMSFKTGTATSSTRISTPPTMPS